MVASALHDKIFNIARIQFMLWYEAVELKFQRSCNELHNEAICIRCIVVVLSLFYYGFQPNNASLQRKASLTLWIPAAISKLYVAHGS